MGRIFEKLNTQTWPKPVRTVLQNRKTLVLDEPLVVKLGVATTGFGFHGADLPPGVTYAEALEVIKRSDWAQNMARGMCSKLFGAKPGTKTYDRCVDRVSDRVARGLLK